MESVNVTVRMDKALRDDANALFDELGLTTTQAINMFLRQAVREQRIPFEVTLRPDVRYAAIRLTQEDGAAYGGE